MEGLIELVLNNPFLLILILGGLFSLFGGKHAKNQQNQEDQSETQQPPYQPQHQQPREVRQEQQAPAPNSNKVEKVREQLSDELSIDEQREEQMKRLYDQFGRSDGSDLTEEQAINAAKMQEMEVKHSPSANNKQFKNDFSKSLTRQGLINSVVMAEVLGSPRARRPYESVVVKRRGK